MTEWTDDPREMARLMLEGSPHARALGLEGLALEAATSTMKVSYKPELVGDPDTGVIAGGVVTTLLDHACGQAVFAAMSRPKGLVTLDLRIDYMRAAEAGLDVYAKAHCYKLTRLIAFVRATAYDRDPADPVATAQATFMLTANGDQALPGPTPEAGR
jgi:uncharacterized protein (TIGR00369 family)